MGTWEELYGVIQERLAQGDPGRSYVAALATRGPDAALQKIGEECTEVLLAAKNGERAAIVHELADLQFHLLVWMAMAGITPREVAGELASRAGRPGLAPSGD
jgi:phosphoribosyl-ATP pyrophosphohydrolase